MQVHLVIAAILVLSAWGRLAAQRVDQPTNRSNVVLIMMDDLGYGDVGSYGGPDAKTPNLDRLARDGVRLTDAYANGAVCTPTRAALISGRYQQRVGLEWVVGGTPAAKSGLPATGTSLPALLKKNGYVTGLFGKWHLGGRPEFSPNAHGFDEFFGFLGGAHDYYHHGPDGSPDLYENTRPVQTATTYLTDEITQRAARFIDRHAPEPFFLEVAYNAVHWHFQPPDLAASDPRRDRRGSPSRQMPDAAEPPTRRDYVRMLERADQGIGTILAALERNTITQNTLVIFTNDNGGEWLSRNAPFFHRKDAVGRRHPRAAHSSVARTPAAAEDIGAGGDDDGSERIHPRGDGHGCPRQLSAGRHQHPAGARRPGARSRASALLAIRATGASAEGRTVWPLEIAGRWRAVPAIRFERRSWRAPRSRRSAP
jgi:arylsulfatase A-like enzyme